jgi:anti-sigma factor RsiW
VNCDQVQIQLSGYLDSELPAETMLSVAAHLRTCASCRKEEQTLRGISRLFRDANPKVPCPPHVRRSVLNALKNADKGSAARFGLASPAFAYSLVILLLGMVLGLAFNLVGIHNARQDSLAQAVVSAHIRSLMANHLVDVASSDTHTVKPWFHGRLDFSPPVYDLTREGYPLIGGRLDYLAGSPAAALVYRHRRHEINLFIQLASGHPVRAGSAMTIDGYRILQWHDGDFLYSAVSDLNRSDLEQFKEEFLSRCHARDRMDGDQR